MGNRWVAQTPSRHVCICALSEGNRQPITAIILARDSFGIKPLYYYARPDGGLAFASELKALHGAALCSREPDLDGISGFLLLGSVPSPLTAIRDVRCLMPGEYIQADSR